MSNVIGNGLMKMKTWWRVTTRCIQLGKQGKPLGIPRMGQKK